MKAVKTDATCKVIKLAGLTDYTEALECQRDLVRARLNGELNDDVLILLEHPPVITLGRGARDAHVTARAETLDARGVEVHEIERGGDVTYHGPGQLVGYPIIDLTRHKKDVHWYLRRLEEVLIRTLARFEVTGRRRSGYTGVWVDDRKIASIGVHVKRWVTSHGFALNVRTDLSDFDLIVPCGIEAVEMTSIERERGRAHSVAEVGDEVARDFAEVFDVRLSTADLREVASRTHP